MCANCDHVRGLIQQWLDKQSHEKCHYFPELFREIAKVYDLKPRTEPMLPPECEFQDGCNKYRQEVYREHLP